MFYLYIECRVYLWMSVLIISFINLMIMKIVSIFVLVDLKVINFFYNFVFVDLVILLSEVLLSRFNMEIFLVGMVFFMVLCVIVFSMVGFFMGNIICVFRWLRFLFVYMLFVVKLDGLMYFYVGCVRGCIVGGGRVFIIFGVV